MTSRVGGATRHTRSFEHPYRYFVTDGPIHRSGPKLNIRRQACAQRNAFLDGASLVPGKAEERRGNRCGRIPFARFIRESVDRLKFRSE
jgi:hypothetical protein